MSDKNPSPNCKREYEEAFSTSISPLKKTKLDDDDDDDSSSDSHDVVFASPSSSSSSSVDSSAASDSDECSVTSGGEENERSSSISSGCFSSESKEISKNCSTFASDLEAHQISENETSTIINSNFRNEKSPVSEGLGETTTEMKSSSSSSSKKTPTPAEIDEFLSELEEKDDQKQKKFIEKYNFDIVNDKPLEGRYKWDRLKP